MVPWWVILIALIISIFIDFVIADANGYGDY